MNLVANSNTQNLFFKSDKKRDFADVLTEVQGNIVPGIDVHFLNASSENIFRKKRKFSHFGVELIHKLRLRQSLNGNAPVSWSFVQEHKNCGFENSTGGRGCRRSGFDPYRQRSEERISPTTM